MVSCRRHRDRPAERIWRGATGCTAQAVGLLDRGLAPAPAALRGLQHVLPEEVRRLRRRDFWSGQSAAWPGPACSRRIRRRAKARRMATTPPAIKKALASQIISKRPGSGRANSSTPRTGLSTPTGKLPADTGHPPGDVAQPDHDPEPGQYPDQRGRDHVGSPDWMPHDEQACDHAQDAGDQPPPPHPLVDEQPDQLEDAADQPVDPEEQDQGEQGVDGTGEQEDPYHTSTAGKSQLGRRPRIIRTQARAGAWALWTMAHSEGRQVRGGGPPRTSQPATALEEPLLTLVDRQRRKTTPIPSAARGAPPAVLGLAAVSYWAG